jgi:starch-binding outer membrane protein, SusD/RagB family
MIYTFYNISKILIFAVLCNLFTSCKKFIDIESPPTQIESSKIFQNDQSAVSAVAGLYRKLLLSNQYIANGGVTIYAGLSADELLNTSPGPDDEFRTNSLLASNQRISGNLWSQAYGTIYHANAILEGLQGSTVTAPLKKQLQGEALVVRALHYFYLVNLFGDVPYVSSTNYEVNQSLARSPMTEIYEHITGDLLEAKSVLSNSYPSNGRVRPNKFTATALLARVYLYLKDWTKAEAQSTEVINSGIYSLPGDLSTVFLSGSNETIWSLIQDNANTGEGQLFIPIFSFLKPNYILTDALLNSFETGDQRKGKWITSGSVNGVTVYHPYKYKKGLDFSSSPPPPTEYYIVLRLAEQYLIRAEARAQQNNIAGSQADVNLIRNRSGLGATTANDKGSLMAAVEHERQIELFAEWGQRWLDLKRTNKASTILGPIKAPNWQGEDQLYPIPQNQILLNPFLTQNPGY